MQEMATLIFKSNKTLISQMLHVHNLLPFPYSAFCLPPIAPMFNYNQGGHLESPSTLGVGILGGKEEVTTLTNKQLAGKEQVRPTKQGVNKRKKTNEKRCD